MRVRTLVLLVPLAATMALAPGLGAQDVAPREYAQRWLDGCRDDRGGSRGSREVSCMVRELGWRATGRAIVADAAPNGGVRAVAWDRDSVHVVAMISAHARTESAARELGEAVTIDARGPLRGVGPTTIGRRESVSVSFAIFVPRRSDLEFDTENGPVRLGVPAGYNARLETGTVNGPMEIDFPVTVQGRFNPRRITTDLGSGGPPVRAVTTNGPVVVRRR